MPLSGNAVARLRVLTFTSAAALLCARQPVPALVRPPSVFTVPAVSSVCGAGVSTSIATDSDANSTATPLFPRFTDEYSKLRGVEALIQDLAGSVQDHQHFCSCVSPAPDQSEAEVGKGPRGSQEALPRPPSMGRPCVERAARAPAPPTRGGWQGPGVLLGAGSFSCVCGFLTTIVVGGTGLNRTHF